MLKACKNIMEAFIHELKAQPGKKIPGVLPVEWIKSACIIINDREQV